MKPTRTEMVVVASILFGLSTAVTLPFAVEAMRSRIDAASMRTVELTGVMSQGVWTDEQVPSAAVWRRDFCRARPVFRVGETIRLRLVSADVVHSFTAPALGIDRLQVDPGRPVDVVVTPSRAGVFEYYCTTVCGEPHFSMRGTLVVEPPGGPAAPGVADLPQNRYWLAEEPQPGAPAAKRGAWLFRQQGCSTCHGEAAVGGLANPNSMNATVPALSDLAARTFLFTAVDRDAFVGALVRGVPVERVDSLSSVPLYPIVRKQFLATRSRIQEGRRSVPLDPSGPRPPLDMPAWGARLSADEIDAILVYLLNLGHGATAAPAPNEAP